MHFSEFFSPGFVILGFFSDFWNFYFFILDPRRLGEMYLLLQKYESSNKNKDQNKT